MENNFDYDSLSFQEKRKNLEFAKTLFVSEDDLTMLLSPKDSRPVCVTEDTTNSMILDSFKRIENEN